MAPHRQEDLETNKRMNSIIGILDDLRDGVVLLTIRLGFAENIEARLRDQQGLPIWLTSTATSNDLQKQISTIPEANLLGTAAHWQKLDWLGTELFNQGTRVQRKLNVAANQEVECDILVKIRVLSFLLLDCTWRHANNHQPGSLNRIFRTGLKSAKTCLG